MGDFFGGTITNHRRTKSATSRSSIRTQSNSTADSSLLKSHRTESTAATSVQDDDSSYQWSQSSKGQPRKEGDRVSNTNSLGRKLTSQSLTSLSRSISREQGYDDSESSDDDEQVGTIKAGMGLGVDSSDQALDLRLDLAKQNSLRHGKGLPPLHLDIPVAETIYEGKQRFTSVELYRLTNHRGTSRTHTAIVRGRRSLEIRLKQSLCLGPAKPFSTVKSPGRTSSCFASPSRTQLVATVREYVHRRRRATSRTSR